VRLGVLGGSFDPIHVGHLRAAENARAALGLDQVAFVPAHKSPHKPAPRAAGRDRYTMACLATAGHEQFAVLDLELERAGESYTVDTLHELHAGRPDDELFLIVGSDSLATLPSWRAAAQLFELATLAVVSRPGESGADTRALRAAGARVVPAEGPGLMVSSSEVRERVRQGASVRYLVPEGVRDYIAKRGLYR
jgi:nicotinate-nucleotide adenylyltransferase